MFPPGALLYFFTLDDVYNYDRTDPLRIVSNPEGLKIIDVKQFDGKVIEVEIDHVNKIDVVKNQLVIDLNYDPTISVLPRTRDPIYTPIKQKKQRLKWTFPISIFAKWKPDDDDTLKKCFDIDWYSLFLFN